MSAVEQIPDLPADTIGALSDGSPAALQLAQEQAAADRQAAQIGTSTADDPRIAALEARLGALENRLAEEADFSADRQEVALRLDAIEAHLRNLQRGRNIPL